MKLIQIQSKVKLTLRSGTGTTPSFNLSNPWFLSVAEYYQEIEQDQQHSLPHQAFDQPRTSVGWFSTHEIEILKRRRRESGQERLDCLGFHLPFNWKSLPYENPRYHIPYIGNLMGFI